jgi:hypothetical protein
MNHDDCRPPNWNILAIWDARSYFGDDLLTAIGLEGIMNDEGYQQLLEQLRVEHRDLDDAINALRSQAIVDQLQIARLKKKKLALKDRIMRLEDQLVPDIIA